MKAVFIFTLALCLFATAGLADDTRETLIAPSEEPAYPTGCTTDCYVPLPQPAVDEFPASEPLMDPYVAITEDDVAIAKADGTTAKADGFDMRKAGARAQNGATAEGVAMQMYYADARPCNSSENWQAHSHCDTEHAPWWGTCRITGCLVRNGWIVYSWGGYNLSLGEAV
jgi:hypothetical protein